MHTHQAIAAYRATIADSLADAGWMRRAASKTTGLEREQSIDFARTHLEAARTARLFIKRLIAEDVCENQELRFGAAA